MDENERELRVKIDVRYHLKLHALKLLRNKRMGEAIEEALDYYFEHVVKDDLPIRGLDKHDEATKRPPRVP